MKLALSETNVVLATANEIAWLRSTDVSVKKKTDSGSSIQGFLKEARSLEETLRSKQALGKKKQMRALIRGDGGSRIIGRCSTQACKTSWDVV